MSGKPKEYVGREGLLLTLAEHKFMDPPGVRADLVKDVTRREAALSAYGRIARTLQTPLKKIERLNGRPERIESLLRCRD